jgi:hypothetical protein
VVSLPSPPPPSILNPPLAFYPQNANTSTLYPLYPLRIKLFILALKSILFLYTYMTLVSLCDLSISHGLYLKTP